jgi:hypothetical protein
LRPDLRHTSLSALPGDSPAASSASSDTNLPRKSFKAFYQIIVLHSGGGASAPPPVLYLRFLSAFGFPKISAQTTAERMGGLAALRGMGATGSFSSRGRRGSRACSMSAAAMMITPYFFSSVAMASRIFVSEITFCRL